MCMVKFINSKKGYHQTFINIPYDFCKILQFVGKLLLTSTHTKLKDYLQPIYAIRDAETEVVHLKTLENSGKVGLLHHQKQISSGEFKAI